MSGEMNVDTVAIEYDSEADAAYITLQDGCYARTCRLDGSRLLDLAADGTVLGIEFLNVSRGVNVDGLPATDAVERALLRVGIPVRPTAKPLT
jgi:uncharacterized protein YuzE